MPGADQGAVGEATTEVGLDDVLGRTGGGDAAMIPVPQPVSYARSELFVCGLKSSEGTRSCVRTDDNIRFSIAVGQIASHSKGTRISFSVLNEANGVGKVPQQKVVLWRSSLGSSSELYPIDQAEKQKLAREAREAKMGEQGTTA